MNDFVDPQRRDVSLPPGLKDLMDVLEANARVKGAKEGRPIIERFPTGGLARVEKFLDRFLKSESETSVVLILQADGSIAFVLFRSHGVIKAEFCFADSDTEREEALHEIFAEAGVSPSQNVRAPGAGHIVRTYPLPAALTEALELVTVVLRRAYGISGKDGLGFIYHENERLV